MNIIKVNKETNLNKINCLDSFKVKLSLANLGDLDKTDSDIVLALDASSSMGGDYFETLKLYAKKFVDLLLLSQNSDGKQVLSNNRVGIVSFNSQATINNLLTNSIDELSQTISSLTTSDLTNHYDAFLKADQVLSSSIDKNKIIVMLTDGYTSTSENPNELVDILKAKGIKIYTIGLIGGKGINEEVLASWANNPLSYFTSQKNQEIEQVFSLIANNINGESLKNIEIKEVINDMFDFVEITSNTLGETSVEDKTIIWKIDALKENQEAFLEFEVKHNKEEAGLFQIDKETTFTSNPLINIIFPNVLVDIICNDLTHYEECKIKETFTLKGCQDYLSFDAQEVTFESLGRIININTKLKNICPNKKVGLAILLYEVDEKGNEQKRGMKTILIPAHNEKMCKDIYLKNVKFVLPEEVTNQANNLCKERKFKVTIFMNYLDFEYQCING